MPELLLSSFYLTWLSRQNGIIYIISDISLCRSFSQMHLIETRCLFSTSLLMRWNWIDDGNKFYWINPIKLVCCLVYRCSLPSLSLCVRVCLKCRLEVRDMPHRWSERAYWICHSGPSLMKHTQTQTNIHSVPLDSFFLHFGKQNECAHCQELELHSYILILISFLFDGP